MYTVKKTLMISAAHFLPDYPGICKLLHGHNWKITVTCKRLALDSHGMVVDFSSIKNIVKSELDHCHLNSIEGLENPTAEIMARWIYDKIPYCVKVEIEETEGSIAIFEKGK